MLAWGRLLDQPALQVELAATKSEILNDRLCKGKQVAMSSGQQILSLWLTLPQVAFTHVACKKIAACPLWR